MSKTETTSCCSCPSLNSLLCAPDVIVYFLTGFYDLFCKVCNINAIFPLALLRGRLGAFVTFFARPRLQTH